LSSLTIVGLYTFYTRAHPASLAAAAATAAAADVIAKALDVGDFVVSFDFVGS